MLLWKVAQELHLNSNLPKNCMVISGLTGNGLCFCHLNSQLLGASFFLWNVRFYEYVYDYCYDGYRETKSVVIIFILLLFEQRLVCLKINVSGPCLLVGRPLILAPVGCLKRRNVNRHSFRLCPAITNSLSPPLSSLSSLRHTFSLSSLHHTYSLFPPPLSFFSLSLSSSLSPLSLILFLFPSPHPFSLSPSCILSLSCLPHTVSFLSTRHFLSLSPSHFLTLLSHAMSSFMLRTCERIHVVLFISNHSLACHCFPRTIFLSSFSSNHQFLGLFSKNAHFDRFFPYCSIVLPNNEKKRKDGI